MSRAAAGEPRAAPTASPAPSQQQAIEAGALLVLGVACGVYLLHSLPAMLFPTGLLASVLTLVAGVLLGLAGAAGALALAFYRLTHPKSSSQHAHGPTVGQLRPPRHGRRRVPAAHGSGNTATAPGPTLPHAIACGGEFSGIVYSSPASLWRREDTVGNWPPTSDPTQGSFRAWEASLAQGTLVLRPILPPPGAKPPSPGRGAPEQPGQQGKRGAAGEGVPDAASPSAAAAAGAGAGPAEPAAELVPPTKVGIPLDGCLVELVADGLRGRSEFIRRAPLLISHPRWKLLEGEPAFYLWADDPASKQQWLHALGWWCQDAEKLRAVEAMYGAYCEAMRDRSILEYAEQAPPGGAGSHGPAAAEDAGGGGGSEAGPDGQALALVAATGEQRQAKQRGWKGWGASKVQNMRRKMTQKQRDGSQDGADSSGAGGGPFASPGKQGGGPRGSTPPSLDPSPAKGPSAAEVQSLESFIDAKWMQSRKVQMPAAIPQAVVQSRHGSRHGSRPGSHQTSPKAIPAPPAASAHLAGPLPNSGSAASSLGVSVGSVPGLLGTSLGAGSGFITPPLGSSPAVGGGGLLGAAQGLPPGVRRAETMPAHLASGGGSTAALPPGSPLGRPERGQQMPAAAAAEAARQQQQQPQEGSEGALPVQPAGAAPPPEGAAAKSAFVLPQGLPPLLSPDYAINAFVTRLAFDLLRRPDFQETVRARIQRQLSRLQRPDYIQGLEVVGVECGGVAPTLRNWRALPQPSAPVWPQVVFDMSYQGGFTVTIEAKVDIRDAAAWGRLDQALTRLAEGKQKRGGSSASVAGHVGVQALPPHAASAPALGGSGGSGSGGGGGEEEGEEEGEPLSPDSSAASDDASLDGGSGSGRGGAGRGFMGGIRRQAAKKLRQLAESTAAHISRIPLRLSLTFSALEGTMCAWVPPPPGNRLFYAFVSPPHLELVAKPELAGRLLKYSYHIARVSAWIEHRLRAAITKNMVFPGGGDIPLAPLMGLDLPNAVDSLPALAKYMQQAGGAAPAPTPKRPRQQQKQRPAPGAAGPGAEPAGAAAATGGHAASDPAPQAEEAQEESSKQQQQQQQRQAVPTPAAVAEEAAPPAVLAPPPSAEDEAAAEPAKCQPAAVPAAAAAPAKRQPAAVPAAVAVAAPAVQQPAAAPAGHLAAAGPAGDQAAAVPASAMPAMAAEPQAAEEPAPASAAVPSKPQPAAVPPAMAVAVAAGGAAEAGRRSSGGGSSEQQEELDVEASLSLPSLQGSAAAELPVEPAGAAGGTAAAGGGSSEGHLISPRYDQADGGGDGPEQLAAVDFRPPAATAQGRLPTAADAWDAALAQERSGEAPTPRFADQAWQAAPQQLRRQPVASGPLGAGAGQPQPQQQQRQPEQAVQEAAGQQAAARRPSLQLRLSATRSLDPDFTTSAEHTKFGEAPPAALPNYTAVRRTLSARSDGSAGGGPGSSRSGGSSGAPREAVGASLGRSLAYLRRQTSLQHQPREAAEQQEASMQAWLEQASPQRPPQHSHAQQASPPGGGGADGGDPHRMRQQGSFKEQAGKFFRQASTKMNAAGKALATQMKEIQQQRAAGAGASGLPHSGSNSARSAASPLSSPGRSKPQQQAAPA